MAQFNIPYNNWEDGDVAYAAQVLANFNAILSAINNGLGADNLAANSVTDVKIGTRTINDTVAATDTAQLTAHLNGLANRIKAITGEGNWKTTPVKSLKTMNTAVVAAVADSAAAVNTANAANTTANAAVSTANAADTKANTAISTANAADSKANTAIADSSAAVSTANAAEGKADTAVADSSAAVITANAADAKADTAIADSATAISTANSASTKADTAILTANTADGKADSAVSTANTADSKADTAIATANSAAIVAEGAEDTVLTAVNASNQAIVIAHQAVIDAQNFAGNTEILYDVYSIVNANNGDGTFTYNNGISDITGFITNDGFQRFELSEAYFVGRNRVEATINDTLTRSQASGGLQEVGVDGETSTTVDLTFTIDAGSEVTFKYYKQISLGGQHGSAHGVGGSDELIGLGETLPLDPHAGKLYFKVVV